MQLSVPGQVNGTPVDHFPLFPPIMWLASAGALVVLGVIAAVIAIRALRKSSQAGADVLTWVAASMTA